MDETLHSMSPLASEPSYHEHRTAFYRNAQEGESRYGGTVGKSETASSGEGVPSSAQSKDAVRLRSMMNQAGIYSSSIDWSTRVREAGLTELDNDPKKSAKETSETLARKRDMIPFPEFGTTLDAESPEEGSVEETNVVLPGSEVVETSVAQAQPDLTIGLEQPTDFESNDEGEEAGEPVMDVPVVQMVEEERLFSNGDRLDSDAVIAREEAVATTSDVDEPTIEAVAELRRMPDRTDPIAKGSVVSADNDQMGRSVVNNAQLRHPVSPDYRYTTPVEDALNTIQTKAEKSGPELFIGRPKRNRKKIGAVTVSTIGFVGVLIGLGLYAGGGDLLTKLFPNQERESLTAQPKPVVGGTTSAIVGTAPTSPTAIVPREPDLGTAVEDSPSVAPTVSAAKPVVQSSPAGVEGAEPTGATHQEAVSTGTPVKTEEKPNAVDASSAHFYIVQVRATTDQSEAKRIVRRLKSTGLTDVSVEKTEKTGLHRIRFEYSGTKSEAIAAAEKAGYEDVWIVGRK